MGSGSILPSVFLPILMLLRKRIALKAVNCAGRPSVWLEGFVLLMVAHTVRDVRNPFYRLVKKQLTLRLDADVIAWLRRRGKGYQTRANALLRAAMLEDVSEKAS